MEAPKFSRCGTPIDDLPPCLIIDILSRLPIETLVISRFVCKSWSLLFSDPLFVRLHSARSPACFLNRESKLKMVLKCYKSVGAMLGKNFEFHIKFVRTPEYLQGSVFRCTNSCHGLLCLVKSFSHNEIYVCNPILGEYVTIPTPSTRWGSCFKYTKCVLGFSSRSNQFKVLHIPTHRQVRNGVPAEIYTIGNGTREWKSIGIPPSCTIDTLDDPTDSFLNGSIHWADERTRQIVYFDFESDQFGSLPAPPAWRDGRWSEFSRVKVGVSHGCLGIYGFGYQTGPEIIEKWVMKEYGVEESWTDVFSTHNKNKVELEHRDWDAKLTYRPSFISLQDVAKSEHFTALSRTRTKDGGIQAVISNIIFRLWEPK